MQHPVFKKKMLLVEKIMVKVSSDTMILTKGKVLLGFTTIFQYSSKYFVKVAHRLQRSGYFELQLATSIHYFVLCAGRQTLKHCPRLVHFPTQDPYAYA